MKTNLRKEKYIKKVVLTVITLLCYIKWEVHNGLLVQ